MSAKGVTGFPNREALIPKFSDFIASRGKRPKKPIFSISNTIFFFRFFLTKTSKPKVVLFFPPLCQATSELSLQERESSVPAAS